MRTGGDRTKVDTAKTSRAVAGSSIRLVPVAHCLLKEIISIIKEVRDLVDDAHETALNILRNNLPLLESISQKILNSNIFKI